ncbi:MAG: FeoA family protein [Caldivirga sp.]
MNQVGDVRVNELPSGSVARVSRLLIGRLRDLGIMEGSLIRILFSTPNGPAVVETWDGRPIVLDSDAASNLLVTPLSIPQRHRRRYRHGYGSRR